ncbi:DNA-binding transcriptional regulator, MarR family [Sphingobium faniae]|nr:DNA-binding transcriptional regulator, MarR family [Sphingobium faniae]
MSNETASKSFKRRSATAPNLRIGFLVHDVSRMRRTLFDQEVKQLGITRAQWWALANLSRHEPEGMIQSDLARLLDVGKVTVGGLIDRLESSGHVVRKAGDYDRRIKRIFITELGYSVIDRMAEVGRQLNGVIMRGITLDNIHIAEDVMQAMKDNLRAALSLTGLDGEDVVGESI